jgi:ComF family protein
MPSYPQNILNWFLDIIFPKICVGCRKFTKIKKEKNNHKNDFDYLCQKCFKTIKIKRNLECIGCKRKTKIGLTCFGCKNTNSVDQLIITTDLSNKLVSNILKTYKYKLVHNLSIPLIAIAKKSIKILLKKQFNIFEDNPLLIPVPLHKIRFNERGFNQAQLIVEGLSEIFNINFDDKILIKKYNPRHQAEIKHKDERSQNVKNNFIVANPSKIKNRTIILIDDICTTGATLNECARVLKNQGAKKIIGFVIARGNLDKNY